VFLKRAGVLAGAAADAAAGIDAWLLEGLCIARGVDDLRFLNVDGFGRYRTPLFADNAICCESPGQAAAAIVEGGAEANGLACIGGLLLGRAGAHHPSFFAGRNVPDGAGGANFRAEYATGFAVADARDERRCPQAGQTGLLEGGVQGVVGADFHAFAATDAAGEEFRLLQGAGGTNEAFVTAFAEAGIGAHQGDNGRARSKACDSAAAAKVGPGDFVLFPEEAELQTSVGAGADAIHAHEALGLAPGDAANGIVSSLAVQQASVAFVAGGRIFVQPEHGPARGETEKCAEWAYGTTPQTCDAQAHGENSKEEDAEDKPLHKVSLAKVEDGEIENGVEDFASAFDPGDVALLEGKKNGTNGGVECGEQREAKGARAG